MENRELVTEKKITPMSGWGPLPFFLLMILGAIAAIIGGSVAGDAMGAFLVVSGSLSIPVAIIGLLGLMAIAPNDSRVLLLFGEYRGTVVDSGFFG